MSKGETPLPYFDESHMEPQPLKRNKKKVRSVGETIIVTLGCGTVLMLFASMMTPTLGGLRSRKLVWQQRQQEIDQTIAAADHATNPNHD